MLSSVSEHKFNSIIMTRQDTTTTTMTTTMITLRTTLTEKLDD